MLVVAITITVDAEDVPENYMVPLTPYSSFFLFFFSY